jgi:hypothetical protein
MAEERKPKIDLKARLGKAGGGATPPPGTTGAGAPIPIPVPVSPSKPPPAIPPPVLPGVPVGGPSPFASGIDPSNPLAAVAAPYRPAAAAAPPQPQRIEVDEATVQQARTSARKQTVVVAVFVAAIFTGVGYTAGQAAEHGAGRAQGLKDAADLANDVTAAQGKLNTLAEKLEAGRNTLIKERKFPDQLSKDLGGINVDFDGSKLAGRRFSGFAPEVTSGLIEFVTAVQALNDRKQLVQGLLVKLQKPLTEQFAAPPGQMTVQYVVAVDKDPAGNPSALLASLSAPLTFTPPAVQIPAEFNFVDPLRGGNTKLPAYKSGDLSNKPAAMYVSPKTFEKVCPGDTSSQTAQLAAQLANMMRDLKGEPAAYEGADAKAGLIERAGTLLTGLKNKVK